MRNDRRIRESRRDELDAVRGLAVRSGLFSEDDAAEVITSTEAEDGASLWLSAVDEDGVLVGAALTVAEPVSDGVWNMLFLAVDPHRHRSGVGRALVAATESRLLALEPRPASALVIETSSGPEQAAARAFYAGLGYAEVGRVPRYYAPDEDKVVFWKALDRGGSERAAP